MSIDEIVFPHTHTFSMLCAIIYSYSWNNDIRNRTFSHLCHIVKIIYVYLVLFSFFMCFHANVCFFSPLQRVFLFVFINRTTFRCHFLSSLWTIILKWWREKKNVTRSKTKRLQSIYYDDSIYYSSLIKHIDVQFFFSSFVFKLWYHTQAIGVIIISSSILIIDFLFKLISIWNIQYQRHGCGFLFLYEKIQINHFTVRKYKWWTFSGLFLFIRSSLYQGQHANYVNF